MSPGPSPFISKAAPWLAAAASALLLALAFPPFGFWFLAWFALVPLFWTVLNSPDAKTAANLAGFFGLIFYGLSLNWLLKIFGPAGFSFWCVFALWTALHAALLRYAWGLQVPAGRGALFWPLLSGLVWCGLEYFRSETWWLECGWLALGYSQERAPAFFQFCGILGVYGLSALIVSVNSAFALLLTGRRLPAALAALLILLLPLWGKHRINSFRALDGKPVSVVLVQDESSSYTRLAALGLEAGAKNADLLVWPEYSFFVRYGQEDLYRELLRKSLKELPAVSVIGAAILPDKIKKIRLRNFAWVLSKEGAELGRYDKLHPIPYIEKTFRRTFKNLAPNPAPAPVKTPLGELGIQICYDLDFENGTRAMARQGANLLVVPNLDPSEWGKWQHLQHSAMAPARAVEAGLWLVRAASSGVSQIIDPLGRVRASLGPDHSGTLSGTVYMLEPGTFYSSLGWVFAPACLALTLLLILAALLRRYLHPGK
ncbi:MAG: apolipoprotein N-acyltransferase [Elusimicrobia bacterium CG08_land_8_20_14_0_20_59_10]|nr:MAG: apolipoprotein N-acyltransferase [Elusimicrobia bacterium CG08_land_8_20_14_0_20_59_10]